MGSIERLDPATGMVLEQHDITADFIASYTVDPNYRGSDFVFLELDAEIRVAPTLAWFVKESLERLYPDAKFPRVRLFVI